MAEVTWTPQARRDLEAIVAYYLDVTPTYADVVEAGLLASARRLEAFPHSGRLVPEIGDEAIREVLWRGYRVIYHAEADGSRVAVLTVLHSSRQFGAEPSG